MKKEVENILIFGFSHSGTSILKKIMAKSPSVVASPGLSEHMTPDEKLITRAHNEGKNYTLIKGTQHTAATYQTGSFLPDFGNQYKTVFIMRNPLYVYSSINRRFGRRNIPRYHQFSIYEQVANWFVESKNNKIPDFYHIRYEDMFDNNYEKLIQIFNDLGIKYSYDMFTSGQQTSSLPAPPSIQHDSLRTWQISHPFKNMNDPSKIELTDEQLNEIKKSKIVEKMGYII